MSCENPLFIMNPRYKKMSISEYHSYCNTFFGGDDAYDKYIEVPCGCCHSCERSRMRSYMIRLLYEISAYPNSLFITLTFDDSNLERFGNNPNSAVRLFLDRCRKHFGKNIRHWIVPEFGTRRGRLHYHGILFDVGNTSLGYTLPRFWKYGFTYVGWANELTARYITKYVTKSLSRPYGKALPRIISSKGIGSSYLSPENIEFHNSSSGVLRPYINFGSYKIPLPRYYYNKLFSDSDKLDMLIERCLNPDNNFYCNGFVYPDRCSYVKARKALFNSRLSSGLSIDYNSIRKTDNIKDILYGNFQNPERLQE